MFDAHRGEARVESNGTLSVVGLALSPGQQVEVIVLIPKKAPADLSRDRYPLRGRKPFRFDRPTDPIGEDDWGDVG